MTKRNQPITIRGVTYATRKDAAKVLGIHPATLNQAIKRGTQDKCGLGVNKPVKIRGIMYESREAAGRAFGTSGSNITRREVFGTLHRAGMRGRYKK